MKYEIIGGKKLKGTISVSGNKNSIFPCVSAALLTQEEVILENISNIRDFDVLVEILQDLGVKVKRVGSSVIIKAEKLTKSRLPDKLVTKLRGSIVLTGAILSRLGKVSFHHPGGDIIGARSIEVHLEGFKKMGADVRRDDLRFSVENKIFPYTKKLEIFLDEASVTACENLILASALGEKEVILKNCPKEPHIRDLCDMLNLMGGNISGIGSDKVIIKGVNKLSGVKFRIGIDYIEVGTYIIAAAITKGEIKIEGLDQTDLDPIILPLKKFGISIKKDNNSLLVEGSNLKSIPKIITNIWPGFPTDLMSAVIVLATQSLGVTLCHDWMYESRMFFVDKLISMGVSVILADPHRVFIYGPCKLKARILDTPDIRAGMALVLASLVAKGKSTIRQAELIERGYEDVVGKLSSLGANIRVIS